MNHVPLSFTVECHEPPVVEFDKEKRIARIFIGRPDRLIPIEELQRRWGNCQRQTIYRAMRRGLRGQKVGGKWMFWESDVFAYEDSHANRMRRAQSLP